MSKLYRKKPVVIEAVLWTGQNVLEVYSFMHGPPTIKHDIARDKWDDFESIHRGKDWHITTLEDGPNEEAKHVASVGDWIIKGVEGEFYPCKPSVFAATYEDAVSVSPSPISADAVAAYTVDLTGCEHMSLDVALIERIAAEGSNGPTQVVYLYAAPPAPVDADAVVEACAMVGDEAKAGRERLRLAAFAGKDKRAAHDFETMKFQAIELAHAIRALKGTFPAAPEAKSEVAGWVVLRKRGDGIFMSAETYDEASAAAEADIHDRGYFAVSRIRSALVDPEGGV